ncbi:MAG: bifunctional YncE family protein/alkaline phosphatase family protein [Candidatus Acidiferrales bacterium]
MNRQFQRSFTRLAPPALVLIALAAAFSSAQNQSTVANEPASEGRPITPAGSLILDKTTGLPAVGSLPVAFVRSPDHAAKDGGGRYLVSVNSGYGIQFNAATSPEQQSISVLDLNAQPVPQVIQNVYFPTPQSAQVGAAFSPEPDPTGAYTLYVSGGFENKIWMFRFRPNAAQPVSPASNGPDTKVAAPFISVSGFAAEASSPRYNDNEEPVYPLGIALSADGGSLFLANDLGDNLGIIQNLRFKRRLIRVDLSDGHAGHFVYPYGVAPWTPPGSRETQKVFVSGWATASVAAVDVVHPEQPVTFIPVGRHPTAMLFNAALTRLYVANSDDDSVSVIDPSRDLVVETVSVRLSEKSLPGGSPEGLALSADGATLYVANAHSNAVAVVALGPAAMGASAPKEAEKSAGDEDEKSPQRSQVLGFIPTGQYPSAIAVADGSLFVANGKGTGFESSSLIANDSGRAPNTANDRFPAGTGRTHQGGEYDVALIAGTISQIAEPDARTLVDYTNQVMRNDGLIGAADVHLSGGASPIHHVIYIIRENRTYDQVFGDVGKSGDGQPADGDSALAIFGDGSGARQPGGPPQEITPNAHALALRFGLLDRFFVNSEASPDGHNWTDAAFSSDYVDKAYRWNYSDRGHAYDFQGTNREPEIWASRDLPPILPVPATPDDLAHLIQRYVPYLNGSRDVAEPATLYLWDAAARAGLTYRTDGECVVTISQAQMDAFNANREREYPDVTPTVVAFPLKKSLEGHSSPTHREFDLYTPDSMTTDSYRAAVESQSPSAALISSSNSDPRFQGYSRISNWLGEFRGYVDALRKGERDAFPAFNIVYLPNDHTSGFRPHMPTPQFYVADNDYALGLLVQEVSSSPYWKDTAIFVLEDDAQNGPDHVDAHRSPALVISAYNRPGALVHQYHSTVSLIRTMELLLGISPMNQLDASASPIDIFQAQPDLTPYQAVVPNIAPNNLLVQPSADRDTARWIRESERQDFDSEDLADPEILNRAIWFSVRGTDKSYPTVARMPAFDVMRTTADEESAEQLDVDHQIKTLLAKGGTKTRVTR